MGVGGQRHAPAVLPPGKTRYHCIGGWVGPRAVLDLNLNLFIDMNLTGTITKIQNWVIWNFHSAGEEK
jgi:hypothetical protein